MADDQKSKTSTQPKKRRRSILRFFLIVALVLIGGGAWFYYRETRTPIDVESATPARALGWLALRDFQDESDETRDQLFDYYYSVINDLKTDASDANGAAPKLKLPKGLQKVSGFFLADSSNKANAWSENYDRPAYVRIDYLVRRSSANASPYALSSDIKPGPALARRWQARRDAVAQGAVKKSKVEKNIQLLVMQWFVAKYRQYDATPDEQKRDYLEKTANEMEELQRFYELARPASEGDRPLKRVELIAEFERMLEGWCEVAPLEKVAKAVWFKDALITTVVARELRVEPEALALYPPRLPRQGNEEGQENCATLKARATEAARAVKGFVVRAKE